MFPTEMKIDYVRVYQNPKDELHSVGCSPEAYPTAKWINEHTEWYADWEPIPFPPIYIYVKVWRLLYAYVLPSIFLIFLLLQIMRYLSRDWLGYQSLPSTCATDINSHSIGSRKI